MQSLSTMYKNTKNNLKKYLIQLILEPKGQDLTQKKIL